MEETSTLTPLQTGNLKAFSSVLLSLLIIAAFLENLFLIATVASSSNLRRSVFCLTLTNIAVINLLEVFINMFLSLLYIAKGLEDWTLGSFSCGFNTAFSLLLGLETVYGIAFMSLDRAIALLARAKYERKMTLFRSFLVLVLLWTIGLSLTFPLIVGGVPSDVFPARYFCSVAPGSSLGYSVVLMLMHLVAFLVLLFAFGLILHTAHNLRVEKRIMLSDQIAEYTDQISDYRSFLEQLDSGKFCIVIFLVFLVLCGPYMIMNFIVHIRNSQSVLIRYNNVKMEIPNGAETAITWLKFLFPVIFPFFVFGYCRDIWRKFKALVCCRKTNMVSVSMSRDILPAPGRELGRERANSNDHGGVPTLVATPGGLHIVTSVMDEEGRAKDDYQFADINVSHKKKRNKELLVRDGTSDYDSEESSSWAEARPPHTEIIGDVQKTQLEVLLIPEALQETEEDGAESTKPRRAHPDSAGAVSQDRQSVDTLASSSHVRLESALGVRSNAADRGELKHQRSKSDGFLSAGQPRSSNMEGRRDSQSAALQILVEATVHKNASSERSTPASSVDIAEERRSKDDSWPDFDRKKDWKPGRQTEITVKELKEPSVPSTASTTIQPSTSGVERGKPKGARDVPMSLIANKHRLIRSDSGPAPTNHDSAEVRRRKFSDTEAVRKPSLPLTSIPEKMAHFDDSGGAPPSNHVKRRDKNDAFVAKKKTTNKSPKKLPSVQKKDHEREVLPRGNSIKRSEKRNDDIKLPLIDKDKKKTREI